MRHSLAARRRTRSIRPVDPKCKHTDTHIFDNIDYLRVIRTLGSYRDRIRVRISVYIQTHVIDDLYKLYYRFRQQVCRVKNTCE